MPTSLMTLLGRAPMVSLRLSNSEASPPTGSVTVKARDSSNNDDGSALHTQKTDFSDVPQQEVRHDGLGGCCSRLKSPQG